MKSLIQLVVIIVSVVSIMYFSQKEAENRPYKPYPAGAAKEFVLRALKAPSTAKFSQVEAFSTGESEYEASGWVDSQNGFGATLRKKFIVQMKYDAGNRTFKLTNIVLY